MSARREAEQLGLWSQNPHQRLRAAKNLSPRLYEALQSEMVKGCPVTPMPYGMQLLRILSFWCWGCRRVGLPPDGSQGIPFDLPTIGKPHLGLSAKGNLDFFRKVQSLCEIILKEKYQIDTSSALTLSGLMNFDDNNYPSANDVVLKPELVAWVWNVIVERLRPEIIVGLGLKGQLHRLERLLPDLRGKRQKMLRSDEVPPHFHSKSALLIALMVDSRGLCSGPSIQANARSPVIFRFGRGVLRSISNAFSTVAAGTRARRESRVGTSNW